MTPAGLQPSPRARWLLAVLLPGVLLLSVLCLLAACSSSSPPPAKPAPTRPEPRPTLARLEAEGAGREIVMYALGLLDVGYQFGGKNPEAGLDCSGMVSFIYRNAVGIPLRGSAADLARQGKPIDTRALQPGDLVFFNTLGRSFSHVGIYIGDQKFVHAPSSRGKIRIESLSTPYFASRYETARTLLRHP